MAEAASLPLDALGGETLEKSLRVLKPGGKVINIAGPPDADFACELRANPVLREEAARLVHGKGLSCSDCR